MEKAQISSKIPKPFCFYVFFSLRTVINEEYGDVTECLTGHVKSANVVTVCNRGQRVPENSSPPETTKGEGQPGTAIPSHGCIGHLTGCRWCVWLPSAAERPYFLKKTRNKHCISFPRAKSTLGVSCWCVNTNLTSPWFLQLLSPSPALGLPAGVLLPAPSSLNLPGQHQPLQLTHWFILSLRPRLVRARQRPAASSFLTVTKRDSVKAQFPVLHPPKSCCGSSTSCGLLPAPPKFLRYQPT